jgi:hypothetical protein
VNTAVKDTWALLNTVWALLNTVWALLNTVLYKRILIEMRSKRCLFLLKGKIKEFSDKIGKVEVAGASV